MLRATLSVPEQELVLLRLNQNDCDSCDARIGFGTAGYPDETITCGNVARHGADNGDKLIKTMGYILVQ